MTWLDDLRDLLTNTGTDPDPLNDILQSGPVQGVGVPILKSAPAQAFFQFMDAGRQASFGAAGELHGVSEGRGMLPWQQAQAEEEARVAGIQQQDWGPYGILKTPAELGVNLLMDPTTYLGFGAGTKIARGAESAAFLAREAGHPIVAGGLRTTAAGARGAQFIFNDAGERVLVGGRIPAAITRGGEDVMRVPTFLAGRDVGVQPAFRKLAGGITRVSPTALQTAPRYVARQERDAQTHAFDALENAGKQTTTPVPSLAQTAAPPAPTHPHPPGSAPDQAYQTGIRGWLQLHSPRLGIIPQAEGADYWKSPRDVKLTPAHVEAMADIGVAEMQRVTDEGGLFSALSRATRGTENMRREITTQMGPGTEPYIPLVEGRMRELMIERKLDPDTLMPNARYLLAHGWAKAKLKTRRMDTINQAALTQGLPRQEALARMAASYTPGTPEALEAAAAHGAALLTSARQGEEGAVKQFQPGGIYFPTGVEGTGRNARAVIPDRFGKDLWSGGGPLAINLRDNAGVTGIAQPFGQNREAWDAAMRQRFPGLADDELQVLAGMAEDITYHGYINAASRYSGGPKGAIKAFLSAAAPKEEGPYLTRTGKLPDVAEKQALRKGAPTQGLLPNATELAAHYAQGLNVRSITGLPKDYTARAAREIAAITGVGNYEDAQVLAHAMALTSTITDTTRSAELAMRILSEWKFADDSPGSVLRSVFKINGSTFEAMMKAGTLRADFSAQQQGSIRTAINAFANWRESGNAITSDVHGGPKTHQYAGQIMAEVFRDAIDHALGGTDLGRRARQAFDAALATFAHDRHHNLLNRGATGVNAIEAFLHHERGNIAARSMGLSPEEAQSAGWMWVRDQKGLLTNVNADGDIAQALRNAIAKTWNADPDSTQTWEQVVTRLAQERNLSMEAATDQTYDLMRQEIFIRTMKHALTQPDVQTALAAKGITMTLTDLKDDALGIISRGAHGLYPEEWPQPMANVQGPGGLVERLAQTTPDTVLRFNPQTGVWEPHASGFSVPIAEGRAFRPGQAATYRKALEELLNRPVISDLFDPSSKVDNASRVGVSVITDGQELRPAIVALSQDEAAATTGAARTGRGQLTNLTTQESITVPGTGRVRHVPTLLEQISGPPTRLDKLPFEEVRKRGATLGEMDTSNVYSLLQRRFVNPIMDEFASLDREGITQMTGADPGDITDPAFPENAMRASPADDWRVSSNDNAVLNTPMKDGTSAKDFYWRARMEATADRAALAQAGVHWKPYASIEDRRAAVAGRPDLLKIVNAWHKQGVDILNAGDEQQAARAAFFHQQEVDQGVKHARQTNWDLVRAAWGESVLFSIKYLTGNMQGGWTQNALAGLFTTTTPTQFLHAFQAVRGGAEGVTRAEALASLPGGQIAEKWGTTSPQEVLRGGIRALTSNATRTSPSAVGELVGRITRSEQLAQIAGWPFVLWNDINQAADTVLRDSLYGHTLDLRMRESIGAFETEVRKAGAGIPGFEFSVTDAINIPSGGLHAVALHDQFLSLGLAEKDAQRLTRMYENLLNRGKAASQKELDRVQFSYDRTNLDEWVSHFVPFHYWYSRALRYYGEAALSHPFLALNYMRAAQGIEDAQADPGLSARQKGFISLFGTPLGFTLLMNPDALFGVVKVFNMDDSYEPDGMTSFGSAIQHMKDVGFGLYPWIDGVVNLMGMYGNTFEPDLLGIRHKALVGAAINFARAHVGFDPAGAPYADAMGQLRYGVSSFVSAFTPDWLTQPVPPRSGGSSQEASLDTIIEASILANNPSLTNQQLLDIMTDPNSPEYERAFQQAADAGMVQQLLNFTLPEQFRMRSDKKDVLAAQRNTIYEAAQAAGVSPYDFAPTAGDLAFKAQYYRQTGKPWEPGDYEEADTAYDLIRAPNEAKPFIVDNAQYQQLGSPKQQRRFDTYWALRTGTDPRTQGLPEDARTELALEWATAHHATDSINQVYDLRDAFEATHPEFAEFKQWQDRVKNLASIYGGDLTEYRRRVVAQNPNAAKYFADTQEFIKRTYPQEEWVGRLELATTSAAAFHAITGKGTNRQNPGPLPGVPPVDYTLPTMEPPAPYYGPSTPSGTDWIQQLNALRGQQQSVYR